MKIKKIALMLVMAVSINMIGAPFVLAASPKPTTTPTTTINIPTEKPGDIVQPQGLKKWAAVQALKYGGALLGTMVSYLSPSAGSYLINNSYALGVELSYLSTNIEAYLVDFCYFSLGIPMAASRSIAWAICLVAL